MTPDQLAEIATGLRVLALTAIHRAGSGHPGGSLSCAEIMACLQFEVMDHEHDRLILSKGHAVPTLYAALVMRGVLTIDDLFSLRKLGGLPGHPDIKTPGVHINSGSLGMGLGVGAGMALAKKMKGEPGRVYVILGDGDLQSGGTWEAANFAGYHKLDNLWAFVDLNQIQCCGNWKDCPQSNAEEAWGEAGWSSELVADGHDTNTILLVIKRLSRYAAPHIIDCITTKGKGVSFMENRVDWHSRGLTDKELAMALQELSGEQD